MTHLSAVNPIHANLLRTKSANAPLVVTSPEDNAAKNTFSCPLFPILFGTMSFSNPRRRTPAGRPGPAHDGGLSLKTSSALRKGATFHTPPSPLSSSIDDTFVPPSLSRANTNLDEVVDANRRRIALTLSDLEEALAKTEALSLSSPRSPKNKALRDTSLPVPRGFLSLPIVDPAMAKEDTSRRVLRPRSVRQSRNHASDSGLGSSVASTNEKAVTKDSKMHVAASAITRSAAAASNTPNLPSLTRRAIGRIHAHTLRPLLEKPSLKDFQPIVLDVPRRIRSKEIICLRDLEKTLIFMAPVSQLQTDCGVWGDAYRTLCKKEKAKTPAFYLDFCLTSIRCIQATVEYLSDREQIRPGDRPYTNGYFIDLKEQIYQYGRQLAAAKDGDNLMDLDLYVPRFVPLDGPANKLLSSDEIKLYGGIAENGRPAELIRVKKDGSAISMATGEPIDMGESPVQVKRSLSEQREDEEEIMRSMARRKKNASPEELAPKKCREHGCDKEFKRPCDLTKHEKTHSRPWKCPLPTCKYHEFGWPTEKEMDRHVNDKHSDAPAMYECRFKPCPYKSKRESNCKQHMEKAHGWHYVRTKTNGKKPSISKPGSEQQTPPLGNVSTPSTDPSYGVLTPPREQASYNPNEFPMYPTDQDWFAANGMQPDGLDNMDMVLENPSPSSAASYEQYPPYQNGSAFVISDEDIYAAHMQLSGQLSSAAAAAAAQLFGQPAKMIGAPLPPFSAQPLPISSQAQPQLQHQIPAQAQTHFSPSAQQNAMLFTPASLGNVEDGFDDNSFGADNGDFQLFPTNVNKGLEVQALFGEVPSANLGFSQTSQTDIFNQYDWNNFDYQGFGG